MNSELLITYQISLGGVGLILYCFLWSFGGRDGTSKAWRRWVGSFIMALTVNALFAWRGVWNPYFLGIWPVLGVFTSRGYGADNLTGKIIKRACFALGVISAGLIPAILISSGSAWALFGLQVLLGAGTVWLGVRNPLPAAAEEWFVCLLLSAPLLGYPFILHTPI